MKKGNITHFFKAGCFVFLMSGISTLHAQNIQSQEKTETDATRVDADEDGDADRVNSMNCGGVERWSVKVLVDGAVSQINFTPVSKTVSQMVALTTPTPSTSMPRTGPVETTTYTTNCTITIKKAETDNDYHLVLYDGSKTMIGEIPDPSCSAAASSAYVSQYVAARNFIDAHIASGNVFSVNIPPVTVTGVGFIDPPHGQTGAAANNMEIHPIIDIHFQSSTGIKEYPQLLNVAVGPNPFSSTTTFKLNTVLNDFGSITLSLFDIQGQEVKTLTVPVTSTNEINYTLVKDDLKAGVYLYRFRNNGSILYEGRLMVQ
jgi:hypothetical protein